MGEKLKKTRWHSCNVLRVGAEARQIWQFDARNGGFVLNRDDDIVAACLMCHGGEIVRKS